MMKTLLPITAGLALVLSLAADASAGDDDITTAIDKARRPVSAAAGGYEAWFTGEVDADQLRNQAPILIDFANECSVAVAAALKAGAKADTVLEARNGTVLLGDAEAQVCNKLRSAAQGSIDGDKAAEEARLAPFKKVLKGDRLTLFLHYGNIFEGKGCRPLSTPSALAKAKVWYVILWDDNDVVTRWITRQYKFKGNKLVIDGKERTGTGRRPPSKACR